MIKKSYILRLCPILAAALLFSSCVPLSGDDGKSPQDLINEKISAADTGVDGFYDIPAVCSSFEEIFDGIQSLGNTEGIYLDQFENKCVGFFNTYQLMAEDADEAISVIGSIFSIETSESLSQLAHGAGNTVPLAVSEDELLDVISVVSQDYSSFASLSSENSYFTAGKHTHDDYAKKIETALFKLNGAFDLYRGGGGDDGEPGAFKKLVAEALSAMSDVAMMHSETLEIMSADSEMVFTLIDKMKTYIPQTFD
ncbi:MAG: hypothetical protein GX107_08655 [Clostridiales bacterium]|nr:hypothetical protein [Clostridiales bacterium]